MINQPKIKMVLFLFSLMAVGNRRKKKLAALGFFLRPARKLDFK